MQGLERVSIRPGISLLSVLPHLNYKPWYALAEFVDNAVQSYTSSMAALRRLEGRSFVLSVDIDIDADRGEIIVRDNAAGISRESYLRAFRPASAPPDATGLSEFGMGMKSAAAWLAPRWTVRTTAMGEPIMRTVAFDIDAIVEGDVEELEVATEPASSDAHFTEILLHQVRKAPRSRTTAKIRDHLASLYRRFLERGDVAITLNGAPLRYERPEILVAPCWRAPSAPARTWRAEVDIELEGGRRVQGWAALRAKGSTTRAGFALLRRGRVIEGSADEPYRPRELFGSSNSFTYQRLFGELDMYGFGVSHTKDGIQWAEAEDELITKLKALLSSAEFNLLDQAQNWRSGERERVERPTAPPASAPPVSPTPGPAPRRGARITPATAGADGWRRTQLELGGQLWEVDLALDYDSGDDEWLEIRTPVQSRRGARQLQVTLSMRHPFSEAFVEESGSINEGIARLATGLAIAEAIAQEDGVRFSGRIRNSLNELLLTGLGER